MENKTIHEPNVVDCVLRVTQYRFCAFLFANWDLQIVLSRKKFEVKTRKAKLKKHTKSSSINVSSLESGTLFKDKTLPVCSNEVNPFPTILLTKAVVDVPDFEMTPLSCLIVIKLLGCPKSYQ